MRGPGEELGWHVLGLGTILCVVVPAVWIFCGERGAADADTSDSDSEDEGPDSGVDAPG
jgi:hypothetical protein